MDPSISSREIRIVAFKLFTKIHTNFYVVGRSFLSIASGQSTKVQFHTGNENTHLHFILLLCFLLLCAGILNLLLVILNVEGTASNSKISNNKVSFSYSYFLKLPNFRLQTSSTENYHYTFMKNWKHVSAFWYLAAVILQFMRDQILPKGHALKIEDTELEVTQDLD